MLIAKNDFRNCFSPCDRNDKISGNCHCYNNITFNCSCSDDEILTCDCYNDLGTEFELIK